jgi:arylsulfatase A-like enzyme
VPAGQAVATPVELIDVYPTLVDLAGFAAPPGLAGKSLRTAFSQPQAPGHAFSLVYHYDVAGRRDVAGRTVIGPQWRYTEWDGGRAGRELYWRPEDPDEYRNRIDDPSLADSLRSATGLLRTLPTPKAGPANRPRALDPDAKAKKSK